MEKMEKTVKAEFGKVALVRATCPRCHSLAFVVDGRMVCCGSLPKKTATYTTKKESEGAIKKTKLSKKNKDNIRRIQNNRCFYCGMEFGTYVYDPKRKKIIQPRVAFDHFVCWDFSRDSSPGNMVAACSVCNSIKSNKMFVSVEDAISYITYQRKKKGYIDA